MHSIMAPLNRSINETSVVKPATSILPFQYMYKTTTSMIAPNRDAITPIQETSRSGSTPYPVIMFHAWRKRLARV